MITLYGWKFMYKLKNIIIKKYYLNIIKNTDSTIKKTNLSSHLKLYHKNMIQCMCYILLHCSSFATAR